MAVRQSYEKRLTLIIIFSPHSLEIGVKPEKWSFTVAIQGESSDFNTFKAYIKRRTRLVMVEVTRKLFIETLIMFLAKLAVRFLKNLRLQAFVGCFNHFRRMQKEI